MVWHIAALQRTKRLPDIKKMMLKNTSRPRQTWREQLVVMTEWATKHNAWLERRKEMTDGR